MSKFLLYLSHLNSCQLYAMFVLFLRSGETLITRLRLRKKSLITLGPKAHHDQQ